VSQGVPVKSMFAVALFPHIEPDNLTEFKSIASELLSAVAELPSITRYDIFFNADSTACVVLEEYSEPQGVIDHVNRNGHIVAQLVALGGAIEGSVFPLDQGGSAMQEIGTAWDTKVHTFFAGKNRR